MIVGAPLIHAVSPNIRGYAGILIIAFCTLVTVYFGYHVVHAYDVQTNGVDLVATTKGVYAEVEVGDLCVPRKGPGYDETWRGKEAQRWREMLECVCIFG